MRTCFVLVRPARPANVGAVARAMANFRIDELRLVGARTGLPGDPGHSEARALAWNAAGVLDRGRSFDTLDEAVGDLALSGGTTARMQQGVESLTPRRFAEEAALLPGALAAGVVFGPEDHGLSNEELDRLRARVTIPSGGEQPSLNLGQAAVVCAYELGLALATGRAAPDAADDDRPATESELARVASAAEQLLLRAGHLNPQAPQHVLGELRRLAARARPSRREVTVLLGAIRQLDWAVRHGPKD